MITHISSNIPAMLTGPLLLAVRNLCAQGVEGKIPIPITVSAFSGSVSLPNFRGLFRNPNGAGYLHLISALKRYEPAGGGYKNASRRLPKFMPTPGLGLATASARWRFFHAAKCRSAMAAYPCCRTRRCISAHGFTNQFERTQS